MADEQGETRSSGAMESPKAPGAAVSSSRDGWLLVLYGLLELGGIALLVVGLVQAFAENRYELLGAGVLAVIVPAALFPIASALAAQRGGAGEANVAGDDTTALLRTIAERVMISDAAKRIAFREQDRLALRAAIEHDIQKGDFDAALVMVEQMGQVYGYREEAEQYRAEIESARAKEVERKVNDSILHLDKLINIHEWDTAIAYAQRTQRMFPDVERVHGVIRRVTEARHRYVQNIEREFLEAANRDEIDRAMELLKEMDKYLTEQEAEPFREVARGVITKARQNLGVQFKLAVHDREWTRAVQVGEQILQEFPQSRMAEEVRGMLDIMRERAAGEQAARESATA